MLKGEREMTHMRNFPRAGRRGATACKWNAILPLMGKPNRIFNYPWIMYTSAPRGGAAIPTARRTSSTPVR